jgi:hypothetical protein
MPASRSATRTRIVVRRRLTFPSAFARSPTTMGARYTGSRALLRRNRFLGTEAGSSDARPENLSSAVPSHAATHQTSGQQQPVSWQRDHRRLASARIATGRHHVPAAQMVGHTCRPRVQLEKPLRGSRKRFLACRPPRPWAPGAVAGSAASKRARLARRALATPRPALGRRNRSAVRGSGFPHARRRGLGHWRCSRVGKKERAQRAPRRSAVGWVRRHALGLPRVSRCPGGRVC